MSGRFAGETALVTGATSGLGLAIAHRLESEGARVIAAGLPATTAPRGWRELDVRDAAAVDALVTEVSEQTGRLDIVVTAAGVIETRPSSAELDTDAWNRVIDVNLGGTWNVARAAIRRMTQQPEGGRIVLVSSRLAFSAGGPGRAAYASSKAAVSNLTRQLAVEYGRSGIRVNAVCPGFVPGTGVSGADEARLQRARDETPSTRLGTAEDIASAVSYLLSAEAGFINGHNLIVDGGAAARS